MVRAAAIASWPIGRGARTTTPALRGLRGLHCRPDASEISDLLLCPCPLTSPDSPHGKAAFDGMGHGWPGVLDRLAEVLASPRGLVRRDHSPAARLAKPHPPRSQTAGDRVMRSRAAGRCQ